MDQETADRKLAEMLWLEELESENHKVEICEDTYPNLYEDDLVDLDHQMALKMSKDFVEDDINMTGCVIRPELELKDPTPDPWHLFRCFDRRFFNNVLTQNGVELSWSPRMTSCAGVCGWNPRSGACFIRLSKPLLQLRPRKDLVETLIHEMIHALLFVKRIDDNHESHGQIFHENMYRINREGQCHISVYHNFNEEVKHFQTHVWRCNGPCQTRPPFFGYCRRSMNRAPGPSDFWYKKHQDSCGGTFVKISSPDADKKPSSKDASKKSSKVSSKTSPSHDIRGFFQPTQISKGKTATSTKTTATKTATVSKVPSASQTSASQESFTMQSPAKTKVNDEKKDTKKDNSKVGSLSKPVSGHEWGTGHRLGSLWEEKTRPEVIEID